MAETSSTAGSGTGTDTASATGSGATQRNVFVLSGGGPLGAAQVGMLRALLERGVVPHGFVGCSAGALNAAFLASGSLEDGMESLTRTWLSLRRSDFFPPTPFVPLGNMVHGSAFGSCGLPRHGLSSLGSPGVHSNARRVPSG